MGTHLNSYKEEAAKALAAAHDAISEVQSKLDALMAELESLTTPEVPEVTTPVEPPAAPVAPVVAKTEPAATVPAK